VEPCGNRLGRVAGASPIRLRALRLQTARRLLSVASVATVNGTNTIEGRLQMKTKLIGMLLATVVGVSASAATSFASSATTDSFTIAEQTLLPDRAEVQAIGWKSKRADLKMKHEHKLKEHNYHKPKAKNEAYNARIDHLHKHYDAKIENKRSKLSAKLHKWDNKGEKVIPHRHREGYEAKKAKYEHKIDKYNDKQQGKLNKKAGRFHKKMDKNDAKINKWKASHPHG
jgi:hypothetical protein